MVYVYDIEQLINLHTAVFINKDDKGDKKTFVLHPLRNDLDAYIEFLLQPGLLLVGFNNIAYDYQMLHFLLTMQKERLYGRPIYQVVQDMYAHSQKTISDNYPSVREHEFLVPQLDLFKVHHFDNAARRTSLKMLQAAMRWENLLDMPIGHGNRVDTLEGIQVVLDYNENDVLSTLAFYEESRKQIDVRKKLNVSFGMKEMGLNLLNQGDAKMGESILLSRISKTTGTPLYKLRKMGTDRDEVHLSEIILPYVSFGSPEFKKVHNAYMETVIYNGKMKDEIAHKALFDGMVYSYGAGGLHAARKGEGYVSTDRHTIESADVTSYYPQLAIQNGYAPEHFKKVFSQEYEGLFIERKNYPKGTAENYGIKISLNGVFGKSNDRYSPLRDIKMALQITINGQLLLSMLCEKLTYAGITVVMANTDGIEALVKQGQKETFLSICKEWEQMTKLSLEYTNYSKLCIRDVNNYIGVFGNRDTYLKGDYELRGTKAWHKDHSNYASVKAAIGYITEGKNIKESLYNNQDIYDFMVISKVRTDSRFLLVKVDNGGLETLPLQKTIRYIMVHKGEGGYLQKHFKADGKVTRMHMPHKVLPVNDMRNVDIGYLFEKLDYRYYVEEALKLARPIMLKQTSLF